MISEKKPNEDSTFRENVARTNASADETGTDDATLTGTLGHGNVPEVDTQYASTIKVSKLKGKWLMWMVRLKFLLDPGTMKRTSNLPRPR